MERIIKQVKFACVMGTALFVNLIFLPGAYALELDPSNWVPGFSLASEPTVEQAGATISHLKRVWSGIFCTCHDNMHHFFPCCDNKAWCRRR